MGGAYPRAAHDYPWAAPDFTHEQRANCSLVMLQQTMGHQFPCNYLTAGLAVLLEVSVGIRQQLDEVDEWCLRP